MVSFALVVAEIWGEYTPHSEICAIFGVWGNVSVNNLWEVV